MSSRISILLATVNLICLCWINRVHCCESICLATILHWQCAFGLSQRSSTIYLMQSVICSVEALELSDLMNYSPFLYLQDNSLGM